MSRSTDTARAMNDADLAKTRQNLAVAIPRMQKLYDAVKREQNRRRRAARKARAAK